MARQFVTSDDQRIRVEIHPNRENGEHVAICAACGVNVAPPDGSMTGIAAAMDHVDHHSEVDQAP